MGYRILDLDNCVSDDQHRIGLIDWSQKDPHQRYLKYHQACYKDQFSNRHLVYDTNDTLLICTARPVVVRLVTEQWLTNHGIAYQHLLMRNNDNHTSSLELKSRQLDWLLGLYSIDLEDITSAFDDRADVVQMYCRRGINAQVAFIHTVCAYTNHIQIPFAKERA